VADGRAGRAEVDFAITYLLIYFCQYHLLRLARVTAGLAESNGSLPPGL